MLIRLATAADIPAMRTLDLASAWGARWSDALYEGLFVAADSLKHLVLIAEERKQGVVGYMAASGVGAEWELENVVVALPMLRRGIARGLIQELLVRLRREGVHRLYLEVRESNLPARALYAAFAFREENRRAQYYADPTEDAIVLALTL